MALWNEEFRLLNEDEILTPALVCYETVIRQNIRRMIDMAGGAARLWPHIKTHKSTDVVRMLMSEGINRFKCATIAEAAMLGSLGAAHVLLAYPLVGPAIGRWIELIQHYPNTVFYAIFDDLHQAELLSDAAAKAQRKIAALVDVDNGLGRTGVKTERLPQLYRSAAALDGLAVCGMHVYDGHRHEQLLQERIQKSDEDVWPVQMCQEMLLAEGYACSVMVYGGTPTFPCHARREGDFLSPGTCVIGDAGYALLFPDLPFDVGALLLCRVISHPAADTFTVDLGYKAVAADPAEPRALLYGFENAQTVMRNEEHWVLRLPEGQSLPPIGQLLYAAPWHICPTILLYDRMLVARNGQVVGEWMVMTRDRY